MLGAHPAFVGSTPTEVEIFIWIMSPLWSKKTSVAASEARNIIILHRKIANYLGFVISEEGIKTDEKKVEAIRSLPVPTFVREVRSL